MTALTTVAIASAAVLAVAVVLLWALSLRWRDASIADVFWGFGFVVVATLGAVLGSGAAPRRYLVLALVAAWGLRLTVYLAWRKRGHGEDPRYAAMRTQAGDRWPLQSLGVVFLLQGFLIWWVSLPVQAAQASAAPLGPLDALGAALVLCGLAFEATGDAQLARFKANPANRGQILDTGLWRYTRHPNYFGDCCVWWGLYLLSSTWLTVGSPLVMTWLLVRVSGVALTESVMRDRPGYAAYVARTSAFFPRPPLT